MGTGELCFPYAFGEAYANNCQDAMKAAEKLAKHQLGAGNHHVQCRCTDKKGDTKNRGGRN